MSNEDHNDQHDQHGQQEHLRHGGWQPTPQGGEYDAEATAFVHLPPEDLANIPLAAPGHGYVPPMIVPLTPAAGLDPSATGSWMVQTQSQQERGTGAEQQAPGAVHWPDPNHQQAPNHQQGPYDYEYEYPQQAPQAPHDPYAQEQYRENPAATGQWNFTESTEYGIHTGQAGQQGLADHVAPVDHAAPVDHSAPVDHVAPVDHTGQHGGHPDHMGHSDHTGHTGQWTIPVADGDLPEESGEFAASALAAQWYGDRTPPATLPGGAPAPWATQEPVQEQAPEPVIEPVAEPVAEPEIEPGAQTDLAVDPALLTDREPEHAPGAEFEQAQAEAPSVTYADTPHAPEAVPAPEPAVAAEPAPVPDGAAAPHTPEAPSEAVADAVDAASEHPAQAERDPEPKPEPVSDPVSESEDAQPAADLEAAVPPVPVTDSEAAPQESQPADLQSADPQPSDPPLPDPQPEESGPLGVPDDHPAASYVLHVNGADRPVTDAWIGESLLYVLRERLGLAGAKDGCSQGECGACNVQVDGRLVASCLVPAATAAGSEVRTVEGLAVDGEPSDVQRALAKCGAVQCGFCIPGMAMTVHDLLEGNHAPSELETRQALCGNLCRCSGYRGVLDAVNEVIAGREAATDLASSDSPSPESDEARIPHQAAPGAGGVQPHPQDGGMA
ncbi:2Fe-2S iron-sulfur cluster-binding protein [Streptomyces sp. NBC_01005]|uniref:2Fe-2S iron-sulfur cluster-binding protein n=1 Tax=unclassified Streptomyces TaxID=2593676 RepID=UPI003863BC6A|nr:2Fe-2S iron-sulfur cluster-binding protein [Streptomyces sp. NBC_01005]WTC97076.1 2Fe-2S iron-sulfur cluster-binding protein [Streptomyces sp. NBC_01650]